jgi:hypothetical protein
MRTLIYKRTHHGDPDPETGEFGCNNCMGTVRGRRFDAVIGVGGIGPEPRRHGIAGKLTWIGIGARKIYDSALQNSPRVRFDHFWYQGEHGPLLEHMYPALARRMYDRNVRQLMHSPLPVKTDLDREVEEILCLAMTAPSSGQSTESNFGESRGKCAPGILRRDTYVSPSRAHNSTDASQNNNCGHSKRRRCGAP